jgi:hypothetical protein
MPHLRVHCFTAAHAKWQLLPCPASDARFYLHEVRSSRGGDGSGTVVVQLLSAQVKL